jgi:hypothetical protein
MTNEPVIRLFRPGSNRSVVFHLNPLSRVIVRIDDGEFLVRWRDDPNEPSVSRSQEYIALLHPKLTSS